MTPDQPARLPAAARRVLRTVAAVPLLLAAITLGFAAVGWGGGAVASAAQGGAGGDIGPAQINPIGHPDLCWQSSGNGSPVTLQRCDSTLQEQQWTLTASGVLMNGSGYCLEAAGTPAGGGAGLYVDFADQCGGGTGQLWRFGGATGKISDPRLGVCAAVQGGRLLPGAQVIRRPCRDTGQQRWSWGYSQVTVAASRGRGVPGGPFATAVTVSNAASAMAGYGVTVRFWPTNGVTVTGLRGTAGGWTCHVRALSCSGDIAAGHVQHIEITGRLTARAARAARSRTPAVAARLTVADTSQSPAARRTTADATVRVVSTLAGPAEASGTGGATTPPAGQGRRSVVLLAAATGAVILLAGAALLIAGSRRHTSSRQRARHHGATSPDPPVHVGRGSAKSDRDHARHSRRPRATHSAGRR